MTAELATAYVRLRPKTDGFKTEADEKLRRSKPADQSVQVSADTRPAEERIALLKDRLDTLRLRTTEARVRLSGDDKALGKLAALDAAMIRLDRARANPKIDLEGVAKAESEIAALNAQLDRLGGRRAGGGGAGSGGGLLSRLAGAGSSGFFSHPLIAGAVPLTGPLVGAAAGGAAAFLTPSVAGTIGLGAFGAGAKASITQADKEADQLAKIRAKLATTPATVTTTSKPASAAQIDAAQLRLNAAEIRAAQAKSPAAQASAQASVISAQASLAGLQGRGGTTTKDNKEYQKLLKQEHDLLKGLDPAQRKAVVNIQQLDKAWVAYQKHLQPQSFAFLADGAKIAEKGLGLLLPIAQGVGNELDHLEKRADAALSQPFWHDFFTKFLATEAPHAIDTLGVSLGHIFDGIAHLAEKFTPLGHDLEGGMVRIATRFDNWTQGEGPGRFVTWVEANGPEVGKSLLAIVHGVEGIATGLAPIGKIELQALTPVLEFIGDLGKQHPEVITALGAAYLSVAFGLKGIAAVKGLSGVVGVVKGIASGKVGGSGGGVLGEVAGRGSSPANPLYVFVVDHVVGGAPGGIGSKVKTVVDDVKKYGPTAATAGLLLKSRVGRVALNAAKYAGDIDPVVLASALVGGQDSGPYKNEKQADATSDAIKKLLGKFEVIHGNVYSGGKLVTGAAASAVIAGQVGAKVSDKDAGRFVTRDKHGISTLPDPKPATREIELLTGALDATHQKSDAATGSLVKMGPALALATRATATHTEAIQKQWAELGLAPHYIGLAESAALAGGKIIGQNISVGMSQGIDNGFKQHVLRAVTTLADGTIKVVSTKFELGSPSKLMMRYGSWIGEGLALGFAGEQPRLDATFGKVTGSAIAKVGVLAQAEIAKYQADVAAKASARQGVQQQLAGTADIAGATVFGGNSGPRGGVSGYLTAQAGGLRTLAVSLGKLAKLGLSPVLLAQIANAGPQQGVLLAQEILSGTDGSIKSLNRLEGSIQTYANTSAGTVSNAQFSRTLAHDLASIATLAKSVEHLATKSGRWNTADMHTFASVLAQELSRILKIPLSDIDKALGIRSWTGS